MIDLSRADRERVITALNMLPYRLLATTHFEYIKQVVLGISSIIKKDSHKGYKFKGAFSRLTALLLISEHNENTKELLWDILELLTSHHKITIDVFEWFTAFAHDQNYPDNIWDVFNDVWDYIVVKDAKVAFVRFLLVSYLKDPLTANQLPDSIPIRAFYEKVITNFSADNNIIDAVFKLLAGVGKAYQFEALEWLRVALPNKEGYMKAMSEIDDIKYFDEYVQQLCDKNIIEIKRNRKQLEYYGMLLDVLIDKGSQVAFRLRDQVV